MKFMSFAFAVTLATKANGFTPQSAAPAIMNSLATKPLSFFHENPIVDNNMSPRLTSTSLNLFGFGASKTKRKLNSLARVEGIPTEKEIRALFELWNSALATGDSRIVASRYTQVRTAFLHSIC